MTEHVPRPPSTMLHVHGRLAALVDALAAQEVEHDRRAAQVAEGRSEALGAASGPSGEG